MGNAESIDSSAPIGEDEKNYAVSIIPRGELAGTSRLQPGTTLRRMGEFISTTTLKERLIAFYAVHNPEKDNIEFVAATWENHDYNKLNERLQDQYGACLASFSEGLAVDVSFEQFWEDKGEFTHVKWNLSFPAAPTRNNSGIGPLNRDVKSHTIKLIHAGITGGACTIFLVTKSTICSPTRSYINMFCRTEMN